MSRRGEKVYKCDKNMQTENGLRSDSDAIIYELLKTYCNENYTI